MFTGKIPCQEKATLESGWSRMLFKTEKPAPYPKDTIEQFWIDDDNNPENCIGGVGKPTVYVKRGRGITLFSRVTPRYGKMEAVHLHLNYSEIIELIKVLQEYVDNEKERFVTTPYRTSFAPSPYVPYIYGVWDREGKDYVNAFHEEEQAQALCKTLNKKLWDKTEPIKEYLGPFQFEDFAMEKLGIVITKKRN